MANRLVAPRPRFGGHTCCSLPYAVRRQFDSSENCLLSLVVLGERWRRECRRWVVRRQVAKAESRLTDSTMSNDSDIRIWVRAAWRSIPLSLALERGDFLAGGGIALEVSVLFAGSELADTSLGYKH